jgi:quercetin dioxygenase-like cupin family protein
MKREIQLITATCFVCYIWLATGCTTKSNNSMSTENKTQIFSKGEKITNGYFTGEAYLAPLLARDKNNEFVIGNVTFEPNARTNWHTHPKGQVLLVTDGQGLYQEKGKAARQIKKGDVINVPENVEHWHGASAKTNMSHIAITNFKGEENVVWLQPVSDKEFDEANQ